MAVPRLPTLALLALSASGCILAEPPERTAQQTAPSLDLTGADPSPTQILRIEGLNSVPFSIPVVSEDVGEELWWALHRNYGLPDAEWVGNFNHLPPSHLNDETREIKFDWQPRSDLPRCFQLTLVVCHERNFALGETQLCNPDDPKDLALATWWVNFETSTTEPSLDDCPTPTGSVGGG